MASPSRMHHCIWCFIQVSRSCVSKDFRSISQHLEKLICNVTCYVLHSGKASQKHPESGPIKITDPHSYCFDRRNCLVTFPPLAAKLSAKAHWGRVQCMQLWRRRLVCHPTRRSQWCAQQRDVVPPRTRELSGMGGRLPWPQLEMGKHHETPTLQTTISHSPLQYHKQAVFVPTCCFSLSTIQLFQTMLLSIDSLSGLPGRRTVPHLLTAANSHAAVLYQPTFASPQSNRITLARYRFHWLAVILM